ncbi:hypothetical protein C7N43_34700 [Sphingobacteriales bacterium UPWRP_1]|nr:hypothetical protein C7N43_34700 [Sphingobacteriales bacterium UPWRP_1]
MSCNTCGSNASGGIYSKCPDGTLPTYKYVLYDVAVSETVPVKIIGPFDHATALLELQKFLNPPVLPVTPVTYSVKQVLYCGNDEIATSSNFPLTCGGNPGAGCPDGYVYCNLSGECVELPEGCTLAGWNPITCQCCPEGQIYCQSTGTCTLPEDCGTGTGCPPGTVYCAASGTCVVPEDCNELQYNQSTCQCCHEGYVYCRASGQCIPREDIDCLLAQWNQTTCECCPPGSVYCGTTGRCIPLPDNCSIVMWNPITCECCPPGYVFCEETGTCILQPEGCTILQYNPITCECCGEGQVFCLLTQECVPLPGNCTLAGWNPLTCECCPEGYVFNGSTCQQACDPASYAPVTLDWEMLPTGGGIQINGVVGAGSQQATSFVISIVPTSGQGVPAVVIQYPVPADPSDPPVTLPLSVPLPSGDYSYFINGIMFGDCIYPEQIGGDIEGVAASECCAAIVGVGGGNEVRYFDTDIEIPLGATAPYRSYIDLYTIVMVDRVSAYIDDGGGTFIEIAQSPFIGTTALPTNEYPALAFAQGAERGYWRNSGANIGSLLSPYRYADDSGDVAGKEYPNSDFGYNGSNNYLTPANRASFNGTAPANFPFSGFNTGKGRLFFELPDTYNPGDTATVRFRVEGGKDGTVWYALPGCLIDANCANCGQTLPIPDECCPFALTKTLQGELNQPAGTPISVILPDGLIPINGVAPYTVNVTFTPNAAAGLTYNPSTKKISGTLIPGPLSGLMTVTDANGCTVSQAFSLIIACPSIELRSGGGRPVQTFAITNVVSSTAVTVFSGGTAPYAFSIISGALPNGLSIAPDGGNPLVGLISGTVAGPSGVYPFVIRVTDVNGCTVDSEPFAWTITN